MSGAIHYSQPGSWIAYDPVRLIGPLTEAKAAVMSLMSVPFRRAWAEKLQEMQLKQEVAGTSRIEGAEFTENELEAAIHDTVPEDLLTRSQKQARAATHTYKWISSQDESRPITDELIFEIHRRIVTGCDDDHCEPGAIRRTDQNVVFGSPRHRGAVGGHECKSAFGELCRAINHEFRDHDVLVQALAVHYHIGAMHPFLDGNGRTARATEAFMLRRAGLKDALFISLSNYYYDEKVSYLKNLASVRQAEGDLTEFLVFGLKGIALQCKRLLTEINLHISRALFRDTAQELFGRLQSPRKRILATRQLAILNALLDRGAFDVNALYRDYSHIYQGLKEPFSGFVRDIIALHNLGAVSLNSKKDENRLYIDANLAWPTSVTETEFFEEMQNLPKAKTFDFLQKAPNANNLLPPPG